MIKLEDLEAKFIKLNANGSIETNNISIEQADGVWFLCPKCFEINNGNVGTHSIFCWFTGKVSDEITPKPGRWNPSGTGISDLTFIGPGSTSVLLTSGCNWHGFITNGKASMI